MPNPIYECQVCYKFHKKETRWACRVKENVGNAEKKTISIATWIAPIPVEVRQKQTQYAAVGRGTSGRTATTTPYPIEKGIKGRPTAINNVETWANIPLIIKDGAQEFAKAGTPGNSGIKFSV